MDYYLYLFLILIYFFLIQFNCKHFNFNSINELYLMFIHRLMSSRIMTFLAKSPPLFMRSTSAVSSFYNQPASSGPQPSCWDSIHTSTATATAILTNTTWQRLCIHSFIHEILKYFFYCFFFFIFVMNNEGMVI